MCNEFYLMARYDARKDFYGKAIVREYEDGSKELYSYLTLVARVDKDGHIDEAVENRASQTTSRHINEFYKQFAC